MGGWGTAKGILSSNIALSPPPLRRHGEGERGHRWRQGCCAGTEWRHSGLWCGRREPHPSARTRFTRDGPKHVKIYHRKNKNQDRQKTLLPFEIATGKVCLRNAYKKRVRQGRKPRKGPNCWGAWVKTPSPQGRAGSGIGGIGLAGAALRLRRGGRSRSESLRGGQAGSRPHAGPSEA